MWQAHEFMRRIGTVLRTTTDDVAHEPLPERWVDLIRYLAEKERREALERARQRQPKLRYRKKAPTARGANVP
jgi:hypothetical protein